MGVGASFRISTYLLLSSIIYLPLWPSWIQAAVHGKTSVCRVFYGRKNPGSHGGFASDFLNLWLSLCLRFNGHFFRWTWVSRLAKDNTTGARGHAKLQSNHHHQDQQTNTQLFTGRMPFLSPNQQRQSTEGTVFNNNCSLPWETRCPAACTVVSPDVWHDPCRPGSAGLKHCVDCLAGASHVYTAIGVGAGGDRGIGPPLSGQGENPPPTYSDALVTIFACWKFLCCNIGKKYQNLLKIA